MSNPFRSDLIVTEIDQEVIVYDPTSGRSHLLSGDHRQVFLDPQSEHSERERCTADFETLDLVRHPTGLGRRSFLATSAVAAILTITHPHPGQTTSGCCGCIASGTACQDRYGPATPITCRCDCSSPTCNGSSLCMTTYQRAGTCQQIVGLYRLCTGPQDCIVPAGAANATRTGPATAAALPQVAVTSMPTVR